MAPTGQWGALFRVRLISAEGGEICSVSGLKTLKSRLQDAEYAEVDEEGQGSGRFRLSERFDCQSFRVIFSVFSCCQAVFCGRHFTTGAAVRSCSSSLSLNVTRLMFFSYRCRVLVKRSRRRNPVPERTRKTEPKIRRTT